MARERVLDDDEYYEDELRALHRIRAFHQKGTFLSYESLLALKIIRLKAE